MNILKGDISNYTLAEIKVEMSKLITGPTTLDKFLYLITLKVNPLHMLDSYRLFCIYLMDRYKVKHDELDIVIETISSYDDKGEMSNYIFTSNGDLVNLLKDVKSILNNEEVSVYVQKKSEVLDRKEQFELIKPFVLLAELRDILKGNKPNSYILNYKDIINELNK